MDYKEEVLKLLSKFVKDPILEIPPNPELGDYAFPCFSIAKVQSKSPNEIAKELVAKLKPNKYVNKILVMGPYINFFINKDILAGAAIKNILEKKDSFGKSNIGKSKKQMIEFFHANTHKGVHIGHIRNICLGESISKILDFSGYNAIRANYQGDIGPHVAACLWGLLNMQERVPKENKALFLGEIYSKVNELMKNDKKIQEGVREINKKLYSGDKKIVSLWKKSREWCLKDFNKIYKDFGVKYNKLYFESEVEKDAIKISNNLLKNKIAQVSDDAVIIDLKAYDLGVAVLLTRYGTPVYHSKDIALAVLKSKQYKLDKSIHVVAKEQEFYFNQLFKMFEIIKSPLANKSLHLIYGLVMLPEGKMSSREGNVVLYKNLINKIKEETLKETQKRHKWNAKKLEEVSNKIAFSALKYSMLNRENNKIILFDWKTSLNFEGDTGPYVQYAYARASSILKKSKNKLNPDYLLLKDPFELKLVKHMSNFPFIVREAATHYRPDIIANYTHNLAQIFNEFYHNCAVISEDKPLEAARLSLVKATMQVIKNSLNLLGISVLEEM
ncbi:arginine--tRNA ligase [Candidatus Woesearchaeota archaeon]|nr:arginine--tRNA ligase [Candidatus Woesearchaeota archaeon]